MPVCTLVEIKSFEPYHIGMKLYPHVNLESLGNKLRKYLKDKEYEVSEKTITQLSVPILPSREVIGLKENVSVEFNMPAQALNTVGREQEKVVEVFKEVNRALLDLEYDIQGTVMFYEIVATVVIKSDGHPRERISSSVNIDLGPFNDLGEVVVDSLRIINIQPTEEQGSINLTIEPNPTNPSTTYLVKLLYRCTKSEMIETFNNSLAERVLNLIRSMER